MLWLTLESKIKMLARMTGPPSWWSLEVFSWSFSFWVVSDFAFHHFGWNHLFGVWRVSEVLQGWSSLSGEASQFLVSYIGFINCIIYQNDHFIFRLLWRLDFWWCQCWKLLPPNPFHVCIRMAHFSMDIASLAVLLYGICQLSVLEKTTLQCDYIFGFT